MSNTSPKTFKQLSFSHFKEVYLLIDKICGKYKIPFYLIGAQARDIHLLESGIQPVRGTMDIDFAIMFPEIETYNLVRNELTELGFEKDAEPYRMIYRNQDSIIVIDILPFGEIEQKGTIKFTEREVEISVIGFKEVLESVEEVEIENLSLRVSPLAGIFLLKLISWNDKPGHRLKDYQDIQFILQHYFSLHSDRLYTEHSDFFEEISDRDFEIIAGARLLGRDMAPILNRSQELKSLIQQIIDNRLTGKVGRIGKFSDNDAEKLDDLIIDQIKKGIKE